MADLRADIPGNRPPDVTGDDLVDRDVFDVTGLRVGRATAWRAASEALDVELSDDARDVLPRRVASLSIPLDWVSDVRDDGIHLARPGTDLLQNDRA
jgi:hypothetical protein